MESQNSKVKIQKSKLPTTNYQPPLQPLSKMEHQNNPQPTIAKPLSLENDQKKVARQIEEKNLDSSYFIRDLIQRYPRLVLLGVSAFLFFTIYSSTVSIFQIGILKEETKSIAVTPTNNSNTSATSSENSLPLWLLGAVTLGSVVGGVAIAKHLSNSSTQLSQFFLQFQSSHQPQQFLPSRQSIISLPALQLSEPKPTWAESSMETESELKIHAETDEFIILIEEVADDGKENFLETQELTPEEKSLIFENIVFSDSELLTPIKNTSTSETGSTGIENDLYSPPSKSLAQMLDLRQKFSLATLLEID